MLDRRDQCDVHFVGLFARCRDAVLLSRYRACITVTCSQHNGFVSAALDTLSVKFLPELRPSADLDPVICEVSLPLLSLHESQFPTYEKQTDSTCDSP
jgi:hypothetical protein